MTAGDATMNVIIWIHIFHLKTTFRGFEIHLYHKYYPTHEGVKFTYGFSKGIPLNILIIYGKDPNFNRARLLEDMLAYFVINSKC